jgi:amino-acid N-acetyltransferase
MSRDIEIRPAIAADLGIAKMWLSAASLPTADLTPDHMQNFFIAQVDAAPIGMIGIEKFGNVGLLRSLVVNPSDRNSGIGRRLVEALELHASGSGITELWLLTIDADAFFSKSGYEVMDRTDAPDVIRGTAEFSGLCPGDAALMRKCLEGLRPACRGINA